MLKWKINNVYGSIGKQIFHTHTHIICKCEDEHTKDEEFKKMFFFTILVKTNLNS